VRRILRSEWLWGPVAVLLVCVFGRRPEAGAVAGDFGRAETFVLATDATAAPGYVPIRMHDPLARRESVSLPRKDDELPDLEDKAWATAGDRRAPVLDVPAAPVMADDVEEAAAGEAATETRGLNLDDTPPDPVETALKKFGWLSRDVLGKEWAREAPELADELLLEFDRFAQDRERLEDLPDDRFRSPLDVLAGASRDTGWGGLGDDVSQTAPGLTGPGGLSYDSPPLVSGWKPTAADPIRRRELPEPETPAPVYTPAKPHFETPTRAFTPGMPQF